MVWRWYSVLECIDCNNELTISKDNSVKYKLGIMVTCKCNTKHYISKVNNPELISVIDKTEIELLTK